MVLAREWPCVTTCPPRGRPPAPQGRGRAQTLGASASTRDGLSRASGPVTVMRGSPPVNGNAPRAPGARAAPVGAPGCARGRGYCGKRGGSFWCRRGERARRPRWRRSRQARNCGMPSRDRRRKEVRAGDRPSSPAKRTKGQRRGAEGRGDGQPGWLGAQFSSGPAVPAAFAEERHNRKVGRRPARAARGQPETLGGKGGARRSRSSPMSGTGGFSPPYSKVRPRRTTSGRAARNVEPFRADRVWGGPATHEGEHRPLVADAGAREPRAANGRLQGGYDGSFRRFSRSGSPGLA